LRVSKLEKLIGIEIYATKSSGIGGIIRESVDDFVVSEVLVDGSEAQINHAEQLQVLGSTSSRTPFLLCLLLKRNWDTFLAIKTVAQQLGISARRIQIAGIKDAKAVTTQYITVEGVSAEDIARVYVKDIHVRPIGYVRNKMSSYYLLGNSFRITIRATHHNKSIIKKRIEETMRELGQVDGVPNFYGHQRFGTTRPITHVIGKAIVKGNMKKAVMAFLAGGSRYEHPESRQARQQLRSTQDFKEALKNFPRKLHYERLLLRHLVKRPDDFVGAFRRLPERLQKLFPQSYQSYLFNKSLSRRISIGIPLNRVEVGDYVVNVERSGLPMPTMYKMVNKHSIEEINKSVKSGRLRIAIPLVGFKRLVSQGLQGEIEKAILEEECVSPENFKIKTVPEISCRGEMRTIAVPVTNFTVNDISNDSANMSTTQAQLSFMLYRGSYATILLREIIKPRSLVKAGF
jgi:tRNA pseudouridine13 synthase